MYLGLCSSLTPEECC